MGKPIRANKAMKQEINRLIAIVNEFSLYLVVFLTSITGAAWVTGIKPGNLELPVGTSDLVGAYALAKEIKETGSIFSYYRLLGFPYGQDWSLQPFTNFLSLFELRLLFITGVGPVEAIHLFYLVGFGLVAVSAFFTLRILGINRIISFVVALSFAWLPWHFLRLQHVWLSNYWIIPLGILWVFLVSDITNKNLNRITNTGKIIFGIVIGLLVGIQDTYYAVFIILIAAITLLFNLRRQEQGLKFWQKIIIFFSGVTSFSVAIYFVQVVFAQSVHLYSPTTRTISEQYLTGGNLSSLFIPVMGITAESPFEKFLFQILKNPLLPADANSEGIAYFSWIAVIANLLSLLLMFYMLFRGNLRTNISYSSNLNEIKPFIGIYFTTLLFFVLSGFGLFFGLFVSPQIRSWGRLSVVIAFVAFAVLASGSQQLFDNLNQNSSRSFLLRKSPILILALLLIVSFGPKISISRNSELPAQLIEYNKTADINLPGNCPILNYPPIAFPEGGLLERSNPTDIYSDLLPYLYSNSRPFSFGGIKGQLGGLWYERLSDEPAILAEQAKALGFCGVQLDLTKSISPEKTYENFEKLLGAPIADSSDRWFLFSLSRIDVNPEYSGLLEVPEFWANSGFYLYEFEDGKRFWWANSEESHSATIGNPSDRTKSITANFEVQLPPCISRQVLQISSPSGAFPSQKLILNKESGSGNFSITLTLPAGEIEKVNIHSSYSCFTSSDVRSFSFRLFTPIYSSTIE